MEDLNELFAPHPALQDALFLYATGSDGAGAILLRGWAALVARVEDEVACGPDDRWRDILADLDEWASDDDGNPHHYSVTFEDGYMSIYTVHGEAQTTAARDVLAERRRQIEVEGWMPALDDVRYPQGELADAAACYASTQRPDGMCPGNWPWTASWWKPKDRRSDLVRAGALILAEIERLDRKG